MLTRPSHTPALRSAPTALRRLDVLLVEDNVPDRVLVRNLLPSHYDVREAATAAQARTIIAQGDPDVVLLDYDLPDADGTSLLPLFVARQIPVVMLTGMEAAEIVVAAMQGGAHDYLVKNNLTEESLERAINYALERERLQRAVDDHQAALARQAATLEAKNREISSLAGALTLAEQAERRRVADLLHDHLQQLLFGVKLSLGAMAETQDPADVQNRIEAVEEVLDQAITATRDLAIELTPPVLDREEFEVAMRWLAHHMHEKYGLEVTVDAHSECRVPLREWRVLLLQLVREVLFNVVKHSGVLAATLTICEEGDYYRITVRDEGSGFDAASERFRDINVIADNGKFVSGYGLYSASERLKLLGGRLDAWSEPGTGSEITIWAPTTLGERAEPADEPVTDE